LKQVICWYYYDNRCSPSNGRACKKDLNCILTKVDINVDSNCSIRLTESLLLLLLLLARKNEGGKKLREIQRSLKWKN